MIKINVIDYILFILIILESKVVIFNEFLDRYNLKFKRPESPFYVVNGTTHADGNIGSVLKGLKYKIYFSIHFNYNDKSIYEDFKNGKLNFTYDLYQHKGGRIIDTIHFKKLMNKFVEFYKDELKLRIK